MISKKITQNMASGSMIRQMFEEGNRLRAIHGPDQVFDFSLGNPDLEPPIEVLNAIRELALDQSKGLHAYMSNNGYAETRVAIAADLSRRSGLAVDPAAICMTVGAAGAMNVTLKALLDPGDEVIILAPFFMEYLSYIDNHGGVPVVVACDAVTLLPDPAAIARAITPRTKALIINSPNNPSGRIYPADLLRSIDAVLQASGQDIYIVADEPYIELAYDGQIVPSSLACLTSAIVCYSWSKSLSLPGDRIGYVAISPRCPDYEALSAAIGYCNRILGFVNAPAFFQRVITRSLHARVDVSRYEQRRNSLFQILWQAGFDIGKPEGGLYLFPKSPAVDDVAFAKVCAEHLVLLVPGSGFGFPGYARLCFAVRDQIIENSRDAFQSIARHYGLKSRMT